MMERLYFEQGLCKGCNQIRRLDRTQNTLCKECYYKQQLEKTGACATSWKGSLKMGKRLSKAKKRLAHLDVGEEPLFIQGLSL
jgi:predicted amidophosphoribosyltransferase